MSSQKYTVDQNTLLYKLLESGKYASSSSKEAEGGDRRKGEESNDSISVQYSRAGATSSSITDFCNENVNKFLEAVQLDMKVNDVPFILKKMDGVEYITVPSNYTKLMDNPEWRVIHMLIEPIAPLKEVEVDHPVLSANEDIRKFLAGCIHRINALKSKAFTLKYNIKTPVKKARIFIDNLILQKYSKINNVISYLPPNAGDGNRSWLTSIMSPLGGIKGLKSLHSLPVLITQALSAMIDALLTDIKLDNALVPFSDAVKGIARIKEKKIKDNKGKIRSVHKPIHLTRPTQRIVVTSDIEKRFLRTLESPWDQLHELTEKYQKGIPVKDIESVYNGYRKAYDETFIKSASITSWESRKRNALKILGSYHLDKKGRESYSYKSKDLEKCLENLGSLYCDEPKKFREVVNDLNPRHLIGESWGLLTTAAIEKIVESKLKVDSIAKGDAADDVNVWLSQTLPYILVAKEERESGIFDGNFEREG
jgi:hypothetical protein